MRGPELHTLLVARPDPLAPPAGRPPAGAGPATPLPPADPSPGGRQAPAAEPQEGVAPRRPFASGGYQVHNGRPVASVVVG